MTTNLPPVQLLPSRKSGPSQSSQTSVLKLTVLEKISLYVLIFQIIIFFVLVWITFIAGAAGIASGLAAVGVLLSIVVTAIFLSIVIIYTAIKRRKNSQKILRSEKILLFSLTLLPLTIYIGGSINSAYTYDAESKSHGEINFVIYQQTSNLANTTLQEVKPGISFGTPGGTVKSTIDFIYLLQDKQTLMLNEQSLEQHISSAQNGWPVCFTRQHESTGKCDEVTTTPKGRKIYRSPLEDVVYLGDTTVLSLSAGISSTPRHEWRQDELELIDTFKPTDKIFYYSDWWGRVVSGSL